MARKRVGDLLLDAGLITEAQLTQALSLQREKKLKVGETLVEMGVLDERALIEVLELHSGVKHVDLVQEQLEPEATRLIPEELARKHCVLPLRRDRKRLLVATADPFDYYALDDLRMLTKLEIQPVIATRQQISQFIDRYYGVGAAYNGHVPAPDTPDPTSAVSAATDAPVVQLVNQLLRRAIADRASDIHVEPTADALRVRFRVDGQLSIEQTLPLTMHSTLLARIKVMAGLDLADRRLPQDGRLQMEGRRQDVDVRVSTLPTVHGEKAVLRILDRRHALLNVDALALSPRNERHFQHMLRNTNGMLLITGPTGSGKTTTLYALLKSMNAEHRNIVTIEDPVEYQLTGINQTQVNPHVGYTFSRGLRAILRQDPDVVMVGEIRDEETAEIAIRGALTGHLVLSTMHTPDSPSAVMRLMDMGVEGYLVGASVVSVMAQRLVRQICPACKELAPLTDLEKAFVAQHEFSGAETFWKGVGCPQCKGSGYAQRLAVHEFLLFDETFRRYALERESISTYRVRMNQLGLKSMAWDGLEKAAAGKTTVDEVMRATLRE